MSKTLVAFDLYGTLLSTESIAKELASHFGQEKALNVAAVWRKYQLEYTWRLNSMRMLLIPSTAYCCAADWDDIEKYEDFSKVTRKSLHHALAEHGLKLDEQDTEHLMTAYDSLSTFPDVDPTLKQLASNSSVECAVFSNGTQQMVGNSVHKSPDLGPHSSVFKHIVTVDAVGAFKPAPAVYKHLAESTGMQGDMAAMWLISGNPFDIVGARAVGMQAIWVDRAGNGWQDKLGADPTAVVQSLEQIADIVAKHA